MPGERSDEEPTVYYSTASVVRAPAEDATPDELMRLILKNAKDPTIFTEDGVKPFTWKSVVSNSTLDSYYTRQDTQSLKNYAKDANAGVMFLDSHDKRQLGFGQSIRGVFAASSQKLDERTPSDTDPATVTADFYTVPGVKLGRGDSDSFIRAVRSGVINDVSIGFMPERFECNLCRADPFDWWSMECMHIPGALYDASGKEVVKKRTEGSVQAFAWVRNARLLEVSAVYDGATTGAYVQKAQWLAESGEMSRGAASLVEAQLRIRLPERALQVPVLKANASGGLTVVRGSTIFDGMLYGEGMEVRDVTFRRLVRSQEEDPPTAPPPPPEDDVPQEPAPSPPPENANLKREESPEGIAASSGGITSPAHATPEDVRMNEEQVRELEAVAQRDADLIRRARQALATAGVKDAETADLDGAILGMRATIQDLTPRAQLGDQWRARVISTALDAGVRAEGNEFDRAGWEETFGSMKIEQIERLGATWEKQAPDLGGGRRTADIGTQVPAQGTNGKSPQIPPAQFAQNGR